MSLKNFGPCFSKFLLVIMLFKSYFCISVTENDYICSHDVLLVSHTLVGKRYVFGQFKYRFYLGTHLNFFILGITVLKIQPYHIKHSSTSITFIWCFEPIWDDLFQKRCIIDTCRSLRFLRSNFFLTMLVLIFFNFCFYISFAENDYVSIRNILSCNDTLFWRKTVLG